MAYSLLAHLYPHIKGSQEDVATLSLQYLLTQSSALNRAFTKRISDILNVEIEEDLQYSTQVTGEDNERPDMAGTDSSGTEQILCEMKFYAGLTANQPLGYLDRLKKNGGKGLLFICPKSRVVSLWLELRKICEDKKCRIQDINDFCLNIDGVNMAIVSWLEIVEELKSSASDEPEHVLSDIYQLKGYCEQMDEDAFIPFEPKDLTLDFAKKAEQFYSIIDKVADLLLYDKKVETSEDRRKSAANRYGYTRWIYIDGYGVSLCYDRNLWKNNESIDTPFWFLIRDENWNQTEDIVRVLKKKQNKFEWGYIYLPLEVPTYATEDEVCKDLKNQILKYIDEVDRGINGEEN